MAKAFPTKSPPQLSGRCRGIGKRSWTAKKAYNECVADDAQEDKEATQRAKKLLEGLKEKNKYIVMTRRDFPDGHSGVDLQKHCSE